MYSNQPYSQEVAQTFPQLVEIFLNALKLAPSNDRQRRQFTFYQDAREDQIQLPLYMTAYIHKPLMKHIVQRKLLPYLRAVFNALWGKDSMPQLVSGITPVYILLVFMMSDSYQSLLTPPNQQLTETAWLAFETAVYNLVRCDGSASLASADKRRVTKELFHRNSFQLSEQQAARILRNTLNALSLSYRDVRRYYGSDLLYTCS